MLYITIPELLNTHGVYTPKGLNELLIFGEIQNWSNKQKMLRENHYKYTTQSYPFPNR
jgi:hypothetical protein